MSTQFWALNWKRSHFESIAIDPFWKPTTLLQNEYSATFPDLSLSVQRKANTRPTRSLICRKWLFDFVEDAFMWLTVTRTDRLLVARRRNIHFAKVTASSHAIARGIRHLGCGVFARWLLFDHWSIQTAIQRSIDYLLKQITNEISFKLFGIFLGIVNLLWPSPVVRCAKNSTMQMFAVIVNIRNGWGYL